MTAGSFRVNLWMKEELILLFIREMLAIYIHLRQILIGRSAAGRKGQQ